MIIVILQNYTKVIEINQGIRTLPMTASDRATE